MGDYGENFPQPLPVWICVGEGQGRFIFWLNLVKGKV